MLSKDFEIDVSDINFFEEEIKSVESEGQLLQMNVNDQWVPHLINLSWKQFSFFRVVVHNIQVYKSEVVLSCGDHDHMVMYGIPEFKRLQRMTPNQALQARHSWSW